MRDLHRALADIGNIRLQLAAGTMFRGFGPPVIAATGLLALVAAALQAVWIEDHPDPIVFLGVWISVAIVSATLIGIEMLARTRRHHAGLADAALFNAVEHFVPFGAAGAVIAAILLRFAPDTAWMLPGLWQVLIGRPVRRLALPAAARRHRRRLVFPGGRRCPHAVQRDAVAVALGDGRAVRSRATPAGRHSPCSPRRR